MHDCKAKELFLQGLNCAQAVFCAYAEEYGVDRATAEKISCGLGGGVGRTREVCGAVTGASLVLGLRHGPDKAAVYPFVQKLCERFRNETGSTVCRELLAGTGASTGGAPEKRSEEYYKKRPCVELVALAAKLIEEDRCTDSI